jgi:hypothetical protein
MELMVPPSTPPSAARSTGLCGVQILELTKDEFRLALVALQPLSD